MEGFHRAQEPQDQIETAVAGVRPILGAILVTALAITNIQGVTNSMKQQVAYFKLRNAYSDSATISL